MYKKKRVPQPKLALRILNEAHDTFDFIPIEKKAGKKQWQAWWQKVIHTDLSLCNAPAVVPLTETPTSYYEQLEYLGEITSDRSRLYAYDSVAKKHLYLSRYVSIESEQLPLITLDTERRKFLKQALEIPVKPISIISMPRMTPSILQIIVPIGKNMLPQLLQKIVQPIEPSKKKHSYLN